MRLQVKNGIQFMENDNSRGSQSDCCGKHGNPSHLKELGRLNRISGQLEGVKKMITENRYCPDILIQLKAIRSAIRAVESNILSTHLRSCVAQSFNSDTEKEQKINELKLLFDRFEQD